MKRFSSKTRERSHPIWKNSGLWIVVVGIVVAGVLLPSILHALGSALLYPIHTTRVWLAESSDSFPYYIREKRELIDEIQELEQQLASMRGPHLTTARLQEENRMLNEMIGLSDDQERIAGRVIAQPDQLPYDVLQIDIGARDGVQNNVPVYVGVDQIIGYVTHVADRYSFVSMVTSPGQRATAYILGPDVYATTEGVGGGVLRVRVPQGVPIAVDDPVVLPAVDSGIYGVISHIETTPTQPDQYGYVPLATSLQSLRYVSVGVRPIEAVDFSEIVERVAGIEADLLEIDVPSEFLPATTTATGTQEQPQIEFDDGVPTGTPQL